MTTLVECFICSVPTTLPAGCRRAYCGECTAESLAMLAEVDAKGYYRSSEPVEPLVVFG